MATFYSNALDWKTLGYFAVPTPADDPDLLKNPDAELWLRLEQIVGHAKSGNFDDMPELLDLYAEARTAVFQYVCSRVLGDAGTPACFKRMVTELEEDHSMDRNKVLHYCNSLQIQGQLSIVLIILDWYKILRTQQDTLIIPLSLSLLLEEGEWGPIAEEPEIEDLGSYCDMVKERYNELVQQLKTDRVFVFNGKPWGVIPFARLILHRVAHPEFDHTYDTYFRRRFEASTGINCTSFFRKKRFQPLAAAQIVEEFLENPSATEYEDGVRYFFGHRIPG